MPSIRDELRNSVQYSCKSLKHGAVCVCAPVFLSVRVSIEVNLFALNETNKTLNTRTLRGKFHRRASSLCVSSILGLSSAVQRTCLVLVLHNSRLLCNEEVEHATQRSDNFISSLNIPFRPMENLFYMLAALHNIHRFCHVA